MLITRFTPGNSSPVLYNAYSGNTSDIVLKKPGFHDSVNIQGKTYYDVFKFNFRSQKSINLSSHFGKQDGIISLEETPNRVWYKIN